MSERNKLIHELLERGCWHENDREAEWGDVKGRCKRCREYFSLKDGNPDYFSPDIPHSTVVEIVTKAVERFGRWDVSATIEKKSGLPFMGTYGLMIPAPAIVGAVADLCEEEQTNDK